MEKNLVQELVARYNARQATAEDVRLIEELVGSGEIGLDELHELKQLESSLHKLSYPGAPESLDDRFYQMLALEQRRSRSFSWKALFPWPEFAPKLALASVMLVIGVAIGFALRPGVDPEREQLGTQLAELKEMMMLSLLEKESATDRLKAVALTEGMGEASGKVTTALLETLNNDENVNVRLAALEALKPYAGSSNVREALIRSIARQESPLVQVALAETMAQLQVRSSVQELQKIIQSERTPDDVKKRIKQSIDILI